MNGGNWLEAAQLGATILVAVVGWMIVSPLRELAHRVDDISQRLAYIEGKLERLAGPLGVAGPGWDWIKDGNRRRPDRE